MHIVSTDKLKQKHGVCMQRYAYITQVSVTVHDNER